VYRPVKNRATPDFWRCYAKLPKKIQRLADKCFDLFKTDAAHPSLQFKRVGKLRSVRISLNFRALAVQKGRNLIWFWIGNHDSYEKLIGSTP
jgi:hypothetical protein